ncbi:MAG: LptA/OstA family protein [Puniceicoccaceae bacterium]
MRSLFQKPLITNWLPLLVLAATIPLSAQQATMKNTVITSRNLEMQGTAEKNYFYFSGDVEVRGTNLEINCEELTVVSLREGPEGATVGSIGAIEEIIASGSVEIRQAGRSAYAGLAEVNPQAGTVVLSEQPRIVDDEVEVSGYQFVLHKGEKKFTSIPDPNAPAEEPSRSVVRLGALPDLGFDQEEASISVDDAIEESTSPDSETTEGGMDVPSP